MFTTLRCLLAHVGLGLLLSSLHLQAAGDWQVADATMRYKVALGRKPTHPSAGYFVHLPDGGILHGTTPSTVVVGEDGKVLPSYLLWSNPESGFSVIFADPGGARTANIYVQTGAAARLWKPETGLTPSAILCSAPGRDTLAAAKTLARYGRVDASVNYADDPGIPMARFSIGGDDTGRPHPGAFYLLAHVNAAVAGDYWISPNIRSGQCEVFVDGNKLNSKEHSKAPGGFGASMNLSQGLHRVEVYQAAPGAGPYVGGLMYLTWRAPGEKLKGTLESRVISENEIARSGACTLTGIDSRDGAPIAAGVATPTLVYWFENEDPLLVYELSAIGNAETPGTTWTWGFPEGAALDGAKVRWIFPGFRELKVKLTVKSGQTSSSCLIPFFSFGTEKTSLDKAAHRQAFREVLASMLEAYPRSPDPVAAWNETWWNNLFRTVEEAEGDQVLIRLFTDHFDLLRKKLAPAQMNTLEDLLINLTLRQSPAESAKWLQKFYAGAYDSTRQGELRLREGELQMYYLDERKQAETNFTALAVLQNDIGARAKIRLGDLALLGGDLNKATSLYADVQNRARFRRNNDNAKTGELVANQLVAGSAAAKPTAPPLVAATLDLKGGALQEVSLSENVRTLTEDGYFLEARQALATWEAEFPLSKISGDYILRESALYIKMGDWKRAQPMLEAYCREIDASSYLPDAASMLIACVNGAKAPPASVRDIIEKVKGRLKYHPVAAQLDAFLSTAGKPAK